jgi:hypothetical protein
MERRSSHTSFGGDGPDHLGLPTQTDSQDHPKLAFPQPGNASRMKTGHLRRRYQHFAEVGWSPFEKSPVVVTEAIFQLRWDNVAQSAEGCCYSYANLKYPPSLGQPKLLSPTRNCSCPRKGTPP